MNVKRGLALLMSMALAALLLSACGKEEHQTSGFMGDTLETWWFDMTLEDAYLCDGYEDYAPSPGYRLLVAEMTVKNCTVESIPMIREDFPVVWESDGEMMGVYPISAFTDEQLPDEYSLGIDRSRSGLLVYEVPDDVVDFDILFTEYFIEEDGTESEGETFNIAFTPEER